MLIYIFANTSLSANYPPTHAKYTTYCTNLWGPTENAHAVTNRTGRHLFARIVLSRHTIVRRSQFLFHLIHQQAILFGRTLAAKAGLDTDNLLALLVFLVLTTLGSVACLKWIEQPAARWLKRKIA